jgi:pSer/pThr/pTyr-binding forkhead associated (FHA) protein
MESSALDVDIIGIAAETPVLSIVKTTPLANADVITTGLQWRIQRVPLDMLLLHIMGENLPALIPRGKTILGRTSSSDRGKVFDLSNYYARVRGVSREHALIDYIDAGWTIEDLSSVNGAWVNNAKLIAHQPHLLRNGDMVQLGQLMLFVYFR